MLKQHSFIQSSSNGYSGCFHSLAIKANATYTEEVFFYPLSKYLASIVFLVLPLLFPVMTVPG